MLSENEFYLLVMCKKTLRSLTFHSLKILEINPFPLFEMQMSFVCHLCTYLNILYTAFLLFSYPKVAPSERGDMKCMLEGVLT